LFINVGINRFGIFSSSSLETGAWWWQSFNFPRLDFPQPASNGCMRHSDSFLDKADTSPAKLESFGCRPNSSRSFMKNRLDVFVFVTNRLNQYCFFHNRYYAVFYIFTQHQFR
jgi:hypothetical protein